MTVGQVDKSEIVSSLEELAVLLELKGESAFKARAYANAARVLDHFQGDLVEAVRSRALLREKGIGQGLFETISEWVNTGRSRYHDETKASISPGLLEMLEIRGLGAKKIRQIHKTLGITNLVELEYACIENRLVDLPGFGRKTQEKIQKSIAFHKRHQGYLHVHTAQNICDNLLIQLRELESVNRASAVGALRGRDEIVDRVDLIVSCDAPEHVNRTIKNTEEIDGTSLKSKTNSGYETLDCTLREGTSIRINLVPDDRYPFLLHQLTGKKAYHEDFAARAKQFGIRVSDYGLFLEDHILPCRHEEDLFSTLELDFIPPELREGQGEVDAAIRHKLPRLVTEGDIRGIFHVHSTYSDGSASLSEIVAAAEKSGYEYIGISDHSQSAFYANGLKPDRVKKQHEEIETLQQKYQTLEILKGIESDILTDGSLDYDDETLASFDFVIASVHSGFNMTEKEMTERVIRAMSHPSVTMLGHPTGRILLSRESYAMNIPAVIEAARKHGVIIELNASPFRLDLDWRYCKMAKEAGVLLSLNPDAHQLDSLSDLDAGIGIARKAWLGPDDLLNTLPRERVVDYLRSR